jgi:hypothetical protein
MQVALLAVGLIVGLLIGLGSGWFLWHRAEEPDERVERPVREVRRRSTAYEPSTPPAHRPAPRSRPIMAMPRPIAPESSGPSFADEPPADVPPVPAADTDAVEPPGLATTPEPEYRPPPIARHDPTPSSPPSSSPPDTGPISIDDPRQGADRRRLQELLEANRRLAADAERLRRDPSAGGDQLHLNEAAPPVRRPPSDPDDLLARHRKLDEDSRRMGRRSD